MNDLLNNLVPAGLTIGVMLLLASLVALALWGFLYGGLKLYQTSNLQGRGRPSESVVVKRVKMIFYLGSSFVLLLWVIAIVGLALS